MERRDEWKAVRHNILLNEENAMNAATQANELFKIL